jgi:hypothetical protein
MGSSADEGTDGVETSEQAASRLIGVMEARRAERAGVKPAKFKRRKPRADGGNQAVETGERGASNILRFPVERVRRPARWGF